MCDGKEVGYLTSCLESPRWGAIGLGYVRNEFNTPGTVLTTGGEAPQKAVVTPLPFGVDVDAESDGETDDLQGRALLGAESVLSDAAVVNREV